MLRRRQAAYCATHREYLTEREVERLIEAAKRNRAGPTAILVAYRHGLRASQIVALRWDDIDLATGQLHVRRAKAGELAEAQLRGLARSRCSAPAS